MFTMRKRPAVLLAAGTALAAFGLAGCSNNPPDTPPTVVTTTPASPAATTVAPGSTVVTTPPGPDTKINVNAGPGTSQGTDQATAEAINKAVVTNKQMTGSRIEAVVTGGVATLTGSVQNAQQKALAEKAAHDTAGVSSVKNKIEINPTGGAKAPAPKTKIVVIHDKAPASPAPPAAPAPPAQPTGPSDGTGAAPGGPTGAAPTDSGNAPATPAPAPPASNGQ